MNNTSPFSLVAPASHSLSDTSQRIEHALDAVLAAFKFELVHASERAGLDLDQILKHATPRVREVLSHEARFWSGSQPAPIAQLQLVHLAEKINARTPSFIVSLVSKALRRRRKQLSSSTVVLLGSSDRPTSSALAHAVHELLEKRGVVVRTFDPDTALEGALATALQDADAALVIRAHPLLASLTPFHFMRAGIDTVVDAELCLRKEDFKNSGVHYFAPGRGSH